MAEGRRQVWRQRAEGRGQEGAEGRGQKGADGRGQEGAEGRRGREP